MSIDKNKSISIWMEEELPSFASLNHSLATDVCIVGAGIAGLTCAYLLCKEGLAVTVLESGLIGSGETSHTTGHLAWLLDDRFYELERLLGLEGAYLAAQSHLEAIKTVKKIIEEENIECDFKELDAYLFRAPEDPPCILTKEFATLQKLNMPVERLEQAPFPHFDTGPCLRCPHQAQFHVMKYLLGLIKAIERMGGKIFSHTTVTQVIDGSICRIITEENHEISARQVIVATNTPINDRFFIHTKQASYRTYVIAARIPKGSIPRALYYDTLDPYHYIRLYSHPSDEESDWIIIGGEDHKTGQEEHPSEKYLILENWAKERFPNMSKVEFYWSGQIIETIDGLAFIGRNPHDDNVYIATGDSGNGLTHSTIAGLLLTDLIMKRKNPWAHLYDPSRKTLSAFTEFTKENLNVAAQYGEWLMPGEIDRLNQLHSGEGAIIRKGLKKYAIYRDSEGGLHCYSAVCPHLGCFVKWNQSEKSWDCPCHGSRFATDGHVLNGPAISPLKPAQDALKNID
ncbi:FAD dependent oxidoreductase [Candidatus Protochlamydia naegleriophila]|uniref:FAD dependent oxidoreductase n=1 Tax=Candidatus Protochlamydia naegleriophila TaxID=389348 RepID=A0A0U5JFF8_9BACT|nr:FAD-dependent oxidoreductase [Candidatus Protochlamydia naegleriophila]CUI16629.1 FAD dependent oxidoreductase [Candidatus Protochlamydia naegleriophila]